MDTFPNPPLPELPKDQLSEVCIWDIVYTHKFFQWHYESTDGAILEISGKKVTALFPWDDGEFLAHVEGRFFYIPALLRENASVFPGIPLGIKKAVDALLSNRRPSQKSQTF